MRTFRSREVFGRSGALGARPSPAALVQDHAGGAGRVRGRSAGLTLLEMTVACALLAMLLVATSGFQARAREASRGAEEGSLRGQLSELASELLAYHLAMAGYGLTSEADEAGTHAVAVGQGRGSGGGDVIAVRYVEDRWYSLPTLRDLRFEARPDSARRPNLYQQEAGATRQPAVQDVSGLRVRQLLHADGSASPGDAALPLAATGIVIELEFAWGETRDVVVAFGRPLIVEALPP